MGTSMGNLKSKKNYSHLTSTIPRIILMGVSQKADAKEKKRKLEL